MAVVHTVLLSPLLYTPFPNAVAWYTGTIAHGIIMIFLSEDKHSGIIKVMFCKLEHP